VGAECFSADDVGAGQAGKGLFVLVNPSGDTLTLKQPSLKRKGEEAVRAARSFLSAIHAAIDQLAASHLAAQFAIERQQQR